MIIAVKKVLTYFLALFHYIVWWFWDAIFCACWHDYTHSSCMCLHFAPSASRFVSCDFVDFKPQRSIGEPHSADMLSKDSAS